MSKCASKVVAQAVAWLGLKESDGSYKEIIDVYNAQKPLPVGYALLCKANGDSKNDDWCAAFVSAVAVKLGYTDIIPSECSCPRMITLFKNAGIWEEDESKTPKPGWILFFDWGDPSTYASSNNTGSPDHVGIVEKVSDGYITVIEGNYSDSVKRRTLEVNGRYIRGYGVPKYDPEATTEPTTSTETKTENATPVGGSTVSVKLNVLKKGSTGNQVKALQMMLYAMGYNLGTKNPMDGDFGAKTDTAVKAYQKQNNLTVDGIVGAKTWSKLLGLS